MLTTIMAESVNKSGTPGEWRRWIALITFVFFALLLAATIALVTFGDNVFL